MASANHAESRRTCYSLDRCATLSARPGTAFRLIGPIVPYPEQRAAFREAGSEFPITGSAEQRRGGTRTWPGVPARSVPPGAEEESSDAEDAFHRSGWLHGPHPASGHGLAVEPASRPGRGRCGRTRHRRRVCRPNRDGRRHPRQSRRAHARRFRWQHHRALRRPGPAACARRDDGPTLARGRLLLQ